MALPGEGRGGIGNSGDLMDAWLAEMGACHDLFVTIYLVHWVGSMPTPSYRPGARPAAITAISPFFQKVLGSPRRDSGSHNSRFSVQKLGTP